MNKWRNRPCLWVGNLKIEEIPFVSKGIYTYNTSHIKITARFFSLDTSIVFLKCIWKNERTRIPKTILRKKYKVRRINLSNFKIQYRGTV